MSLLDALSDRVNPIVLLEVRRGLRTRVFSVVFSLLLLACAVIALVAFGTYQQGQSGEHGRVTFAAVFFCLGGVSFFLLPFSAYRSLVRERDEKTWPLLVLTGLTPRRILAGKVGSYVLQAGLYASAIAPFLLFAYLLQGISLVVVVLLIGGAIVLHLFLTVAAVATATLAETKLVRNAIALLLGAALGLVTILSLALAANLPSMHSSDLDEMLAIGGVASWFMLAYGLVFFAVAVSRLTFESDNHALWPRLALLFHFAGTTALCYVVVLSGHTPGGLGAVLGIGGCAHALVVGVFCASGRPGTSQRLLAHPPRFSLLGLLMPGAARGLRFSTLLALLFMGAGLGLTLLERAVDPEKNHCAILGAGALAVLYLAVPIALGRGALRRWMPAPAYLQVFGALLVISAMGVPPIVALVADLKVDHAGLNYLNPVIAVGQIHDAVDWARALILWALAAAMLWAAHRISGERDREAGGG